MSSEAVKLIVVGAGGHASEVAAYVLDLEQRGTAVTLVGFVDESRPPGQWLNSRVLGNFDDLAVFLREHADSTFHYITAVGSNATRRRFVEAIDGLAVHNLLLWTLRHPGAMTGHEVTVGEGTCLAPGSIVTTRARLGRHCIVNVNASVSHDAVIGDFCNINPGAVICGNASIAEGAHIGAGATVIERIRIGRGVTVGAGAVVVRDLPDHVTAIGVPARAVRREDALDVVMDESAG